MVVKDAGAEHGAGAGLECSASLHVSAWTGRQQRGPWPWPWYDVLKLPRRDLSAAVLSSTVIWTGTRKAMRGPG
jgi:hypothetical protein